MKKIGIVGWNTGENSFGVTKPYMEWLSLFGLVHILTPQSDIIEDLDLLILPGGLDLAPQTYNRVPSFYTSNTDVLKQFFFEVNLPKYMEKNIPIFGICLGFQQLVSKFNGTLNQHYPFEYSTKSRYERVDTLKYNAEFVEENPNEFANFFKKKEKYEVNSLHHQGTFDLPTEMVIARSLDHNVEIAKFSENIYGVQYHPEELVNDPISNYILFKLLKLNIKNEEN